MAARLQPPAGDLEPGRHPCLATREGHPRGVAEVIVESRRARRQSAVDLDPRVDERQQREPLRLLRVEGLHPAAQAERQVRVDRLPTERGRGPLEPRVHVPDGDALVAADRDAGLDRPGAAQAPGADPDLADVVEARAGEDDRPAPLRLRRPGRPARVGLPRQALDRGKVGGHRHRRLLGRPRPRPESELDARGAQPQDVDPPGRQLEQVDRAPAAVHDTLELAAVPLLDDPEPAEAHDAGHDAPGRVERHPELLGVLVDPALDAAAADEVEPGPRVGDLQRAEDGEERDEDAAETHRRDGLAPHSMWFFTAYRTRAALESSPSAASSCTCGRRRCAC